MRISFFASCLTLVSAGSDSSSFKNVRRVTMEEEESADCEQHEIDFVLVEGDAVRSSVEKEIVDMLEVVGIKVNTRKLTKEEFNAAEQAGDFHLSFSETWGAPYDPHAYSKGWIAGDEGHNQALSGLNGERESLYAAIEDVLKEENHVERATKWEAIHGKVHDSATMLPLWGARVPTVMNSNRLTKFQAGNQQFDYPVHLLEVLDDSNKIVRIAPAGQTGLFSSVGRLDPHTYRPNEFFSNNWVYEGLVSYGSFGQVLPALAQSWTMIDEGEGQRYTFMLRPDVTFHDGEDWNCAAASLNFDHVLAEPLRTPDWHGWYGLIDQIKSWECKGDMEFVVNTKNKYYPFLQELSFIRPLRMLSPAAFANDADPFTSNSCHVGWGNITSSNSDKMVQCAGITNISGTGPFVFDSRAEETIGDTKVDNEVVFKGNTNYWGGAPSMETLIIKRYEDSDAVKAALLDGSLDLVWGSGVLPAQDLIELDADETNNLSVFHSDDIQNVIILLNSGKAPLDDINVRKTIIHAINKKKIIDDNLGGLFKPVDNVFPRDAPYCDVDVTPRWDYDLQKAKFLNCFDGEAWNGGLVLGLGITGLACFVLLCVAGIFVCRSKQLETQLEELKVKEGAVKA